MLIDYFDFEKENLAEWLRSKSTYIKETDSVFASDGLGDVTNVTVTSFVVKVDMVYINYILSDEAVESDATLVVQLTQNGYKYISNDNAYLKLINS